jgi:hypothetical protein
MLLNIRNGKYITLISSINAGICSDEFKQSTSSSFTQGCTARGFAVSSPESKEGPTSSSESKFRIGKSLIMPLISALALI